MRAHSLCVGSPRVQTSSEREEGRGCRHHAGHHPLPLNIDCASILKMLERGDIPHFRWPDYVRKDTDRYESTRLRYWVRPGTYMICWPTLR